MEFQDLSELIFKRKIDIKKKPALFFDRDGVLIEDRNYISNTNDVFLEKDSKNLVRFAYNQGWIIVIVSNQSGISRKLLTWQNYLDITHTMVSLFGEPNPFHAIYANSQGPYSKNKSWRKPSPKMIIRASEILNIDLEKSILVGDRTSDILAGLNAGIKLNIHTKTGHGIRERKNIIRLKNELKNQKKFTFVTIDDLSQFPTKFLYKIL